MRFLNHVVAVFGLLLCVSCRVETQDIGRDDAIRYYLNQQNYEQAIGLLKEKLTENPHDDEAKIQLASAYSGSVGINTIDCFEALKPKLFDKAAESASSLKADFDAVSFALDPMDGADKSNAKQQRQREAIKAVEKELLKFASQAADALDIAFRLPHVPIAQRDRIMQSMSLLTEIHEDSNQYLTAQLYQAILGMVQFVNYIRDAVPAGTELGTIKKSWYSFYCQLDLGVMLPNLSKSIEFLGISFTSLANAGRRSDNPIYENLVESKTALVGARQVYLMNQDIFDLTDWSMRATKGEWCAL